MSCCGPPLEGVGAGCVHPMRETFYAQDAEYRSSVLLMEPLLCVEAVTRLVQPFPKDFSLRY